MIIKPNNETTFYAFSISSCGVKSTKHISNEDKIEGNWFLLAMNNKEVYKGNEVKAVVLSLEINKGNKRLLGFDSCNNFFGQITKLTTSEIEFGNIASTRKACFGGSFDIAFYYKLLSKVSYYKIEKEQLKLLDKQHKELLRFKR